MSASRRTGAQLRGSADPFWWGLAALLSLGSAWLPTLLKLEGDQFMRMLVMQCALFLSGALVGCVQPERPWRWAVASFIAFAARDLVVTLGTTGLQAADGPGTLVLIAHHIGSYCLVALPVLLGALLGASMMSAGLDE